MHIALMFASPLLSLALVATAQAEGHFTGNLTFHPVGCEKVRECYLDETFHYVDSKGGDWEAQKDDKTDGASIPDWAQRIVGYPFDPSFIRAAVIHDHYCDRHVRSMLQTHWVFYDGLLASHVSPAKAKIMYAAILIGGPKWIDLIPGKPCKQGATCIQRVSKVQLPSEAYVTTAEDAHSVIARGPQYDEPQVRAAIEEIRRKIELNPEAVSEDDILAEARKLPQNQFFFDNIDGVVINPPQNDVRQ
ncbi:DUF1353 domain-containing protein [Mesorhizobium sp. VK25A]|uniref:DUF1353 domain-containing protein n=1 Tax=Mesorhizobium vachelliae TaxID=3072309 RepID=A0ABU5ABX5_9HYPH|nr:MULTISPECIES: DUF1353 domain-containing protein [unclassified Mesorhizobium]MDX8535185.1 DUF1353 domain-containing protein [Mesorhizobium sp. VK25D]MDX8547961.1 DUF1353 domain-containing protein [Mesorhizobium sp. VK25A]